MTSQAGPLSPWRASWPVWRAVESTHGQVRVKAIRPGWCSASRIAEVSEAGQVITIDLGNFGAECTEAHHARGVVPAPPGELQTKGGGNVTVGRGGRMSALADRDGQNLGRMTRGGVVDGKGRPVAAQELKQQLGQADPGARRGR